MEENSYWMINKASYIVDGKEVLKGQMIKLNRGDRPIINESWRVATKEEIDGMSYYMGTFFNLRFV